MSQPEKKSASAKKLLPLWALLSLDAILIAGNLLTFAYFHHVNPVQKQQPDNLAEYTSYVPPQHSRTRATTPTATTTTASGTTDSAISGTQTTDLTETAGNTETTAADTTATAGNSTQSKTGSVSSASTSTTTTTATTASTAQQLLPDLSGWGAKWPDKFSYDDTVTSEEFFYKSHDLNITVTKQQSGSSVAYVADVYLRYYDNFMSAVINNDWADRSQQAIASMPRLAGEVGAVLAVNGDFIAQRHSGYIVRNGVVRRDIERDAVGCYYCDGSFRSFKKDDFDLQTELNNQLYHTLTFGPILVQTGTAGTNIRTSVAAAAPRTAFGYYEPGHYAIVVVDGRQEGYSIGMTIDELAAFMVGLGCKEAYNLDGGASSVMYFNGQVINRQSGSRGVSDIFYFGEVE